MATGFFLRVGDKTTCGGQILTGDETFTWYGVAAAREGDLVSCGKHPGSYKILGGVYDVWDEERPLAGSLDSVSSCPCRSRFIPSIPDCYEKESAPAVRSLSVPAAGATQFGQSARREEEPEQHAQAAKKKKREITLTIGVFFDGTGNNANNSGDRQAACTGERYGMNDAEAVSALEQCIRLNRDVSGTAAGSYLGYYTNVYWLSTLYNLEIKPDTGAGQHAIYIEGIGTEDGAGDNAYGMGTGRGDTGVVRKTDKAVAMLAAGIQGYFNRHDDARSCVIKELQFDIFGFSRGRRRRVTLPTGYSVRTAPLLRQSGPGWTGSNFPARPAVKPAFWGYLIRWRPSGRRLTGLTRTAPIPER